MSKKYAVTVETTTADLASKPTTWRVEATEGGLVTLSRDGVPAIECGVGEAFHLGMLLVEAAAKSTRTKAKFEVGPNLRNAPNWSSFAMTIPTDADGKNLLGR